MIRLVNIRLVNALAGAFALGVVSIASSPVMSQSYPQRWTGFYVGGNVGGTFDNAFSGGGQIGYNWQAKPNWVLGIEADLQTANIRSQTTSSQAFPTSVPGAPFVCQLNTPNLPASLPSFIDLTDPSNGLRNLLQTVIGAPAVSSPAQCAALASNPTVHAVIAGAFGAAAPTFSFTNSPTSVSYSLSGRLDWFGTIRGRIGFEPANDLLLYVTGGLAYGEGQLALSTTTATTQTPALTGIISTTTFSTFMTTRDKMLVGYAIGIGAEYAFNQRWSMKGEYLYVDLGRAGIGDQRVSFNTNVGRLGINYRF
jgi:opacity protein-like surface antigen